MKKLLLDVGKSFSIGVSVVGWVWFALIAMLMSCGAVIHATNEPALVNQIDKQWDSNDVGRNRFKLKIGGLGKEEPEATP